jgi:hypothetical protein
MALWNKGQKFHIIFVIWHARIRRWYTTFSEIFVQNIFLFVYSTSILYSSSSVTVTFLKLCFFYTFRFYSVLGRICGVVFWCERIVATHLWTVNTFVSHIVLIYSVMLEAWKQLLNIVGIHYEEFQLLAGLLCCCCCCCCYWCYCCFCLACYWYWQSFPQCKMYVERGQSTQQYS